jgi:glycosyltransferase involved in cell wall biosynthesis
VSCFLCPVGLFFKIPWILKQRKIWNNSVKGSPKALILRGFTVEKIVDQGYELILPYRNPSLKWTGFLDPTNAVQTETRITDDFYLMTWESPKIVKFMEKIKLKSTAILFRELIAIFKLISYCVHEQIGVLRVYKHDYPALQAFLVSSFINIPYIVDICGNFELMRRLTGRVFYFRELNKLPFMKTLAGGANNWLLGLPLRHAFRVLGRNKTCYEHAFALGAPVERMSLLRISNFSADFNSYNPEQPAVKPAEYPYFLLVGRLVEVKFPLDVIAAFDLAASHLPEHRLVIIGDGAIRDDVEQRKECSEYKERIVLLGRCPSNIVYNWTAHAKAAICPYSGSTLVEAMLCGIPIIAYDVAWHPEIVIDNYTGFLVPFRNTAALAEKMIDVAHNHEEARIVAMRGRELARVAFDKDKIREKESMFYRHALADSQN